jgi:hypothetical protein
VRFVEFIRKTPKGCKEIHLLIGEIMENYFIIDDIYKYIEHLRHCAAEHIHKNYDENLDDYITLDQLHKTVLEKTKKKGKNIIITESANIELFEIICDWIYGVGLARLASQNLVECAWDDQQNCMVFWSPKNTEISDESKNTTNSGD